MDASGTSLCAGCSVIAVDHELRPRSLGDFIGQRDVIANLTIAVHAARRAGRTLDHVLLAGPSGCGKSSLAGVVAAELGADLHVTSGPTIGHKGELASLLTMLDEHDVLFVDEIHRLSPVLQESIYPAMEDLRFDMFASRAKAITIRLPPFTLVAATTRPALLAAPFRDRFGIRLSLGRYDSDDMVAIVRRSATRLGIAIDEDGAAEIARRSRGTPRVANRLLRRARDHAESSGAEQIDGKVAATALDQIGLDSAGLDATDRAYLHAICDTFGGGPVGIEAIAASIGEERQTLEDVVEPFLIVRGFVVRTGRGRVATPAGVEHSQRYAEQTWRGSTRAKGAVAVRPE